jgi:PTS system nitrogen regulatory IIA component
MDDKANGTNFASLFTPNDTLCQTQCTDRDELLKKMLEVLAYNHGIGNVDRAFKQVIEREEKISTVIASGIAVPHARLHGVEKIVVGVATSRTGIQFNGDADAVHLIIMILAPKGQPGAYLQALSAFAKILNEPGIAKRIAEMDKPGDVWRFFDRGGLVLPDYVCAGDIMKRDMAVVLENDTLEHAIDMLVDQHNIDIPVVDKAGVLVGAVSSYELLKVCLPDYILWMDDLSPIINFEPFSQVLRNEGKAWLTEIMSTDIAKVQLDAPAIQVAKEITKRGARQVYVLDGDKLVGEISLQDFIDKVLRE